MCEDPVSKKRGWRGTFLTSTSERSKRRAVPRREPLAPRDAPGVFLPRHAHIPISTNMVVASVVAAPCAVPARLGARKSYGAAAVRPASGAARVVPRRGAGACPPDLRRPAAATPRGRRARPSLRSFPAREGGRSAPRGPDRARRPTPTAQIRRTSSESVLSLSGRAAPRPFEARRRLRPRAPTRSRTRPLTLSNPLEPSRHLSRRQSRRARPGALRAPVPRRTTFGESAHGGGVGCVVDGVPPKLNITQEELQFELDRRRPSGSRASSPLATRRTRARFYPAAVWTV